MVESQMLRSGAVVFGGARPSISGSVRLILCDGVQGQSQTAVPAADGVREMLHTMPEKMIAAASPILQGKKAVAAGSVIKPMKDARVLEKKQRANSG